MYHIVSGYDYHTLSKYELWKWYRFKSATPILEIVTVIRVKRMFFDLSKDVL